MGWTVADDHQQACRGDLLWSQEWGVGFRHANQQSTMPSFLGLQWDMAGSSAVTSGSCCTPQRVDWAWDAFEAHNPPSHLRARDHVAVRHSPVSGRLYRRGPRGPECPREKNRVRGTPSLHFSLAATRLVSDGRPSLTEQWHYTVPPNVHGFGLCVAARPKCGRNTGVSGARE